MADPIRPTAGEARDEFREIFDAWNVSGDSVLMLYAALRKYHVAALTAAADGAAAGMRERIDTLLSAKFFANLGCDEPAPRTVRVAVHDAIMALPSESPPSRKTETEDGPGNVSLSGRGPDADGGASVGEDWPSNGIEFNRWYCDLPRFLEVLRRFQWVKDMRFKYVDLRIDTRSGHFVLKDRDGNAASPADIAKHVRPFATPSPAVPEGYALVPKSAIAWLMGEGPDANGDHFDEPPAAYRYWWRSHFRRLLSAAPSPNSQGSEVGKSETYRREPDPALAAFTAYFVENYPGPDTIIHDPKWHAPRIFRAAVQALKCRSLPLKAGEKGE